MRDTTVSPLMSSFSCVLFLTLKHLSFYIFNELFNFPLLYSLITNGVAGKRSLEQFLIGVVYLFFFPCENIGLGMRRARNFPPSTFRTSVTATIGADYLHAIDTAHPTLFINGPPLNC